MIRAEPKSILNYLAEHFVIIKRLFDIQNNQKIITQEQIDIEIKEYGKDIDRQLHEYQILKYQDNGFVINSGYFHFLRFIFRKFEPLLPESIKKFRQSIGQLFVGIKDDRGEDKNLLLNRIENLSGEISDFRDLIVNNTFGLLDQTRELKANIDNIDYQDKVKKAHDWINYYIEPLVNILDVNHSQSIINLLLDISTFINTRRLDYGDEGIRIKFEIFYYALRSVENDIQKQSSILINELAPLLERIKTENEILSGIHCYLNNNYDKMTSPQLIPIQNNHIYSIDIAYKKKLYFDQFSNKETILIQESGRQIQCWIFDKQLFKSKLDAVLPVQDFFSWCDISIKEETSNIDDFFMVCSLLFEQDYQVKHISTDNILIIRDEVELLMPKLEVSKLDTQEK